MTELYLMGNEAQRRKAVGRAERIRWFVAPLAEGGWSLRQIAETLSAHGIATPSGRGSWQPEQVRRVINRLHLKAA